MDFVRSLFSRCFPKTPRNVSATLPLESDAGTSLQSLSSDVRDSDAYHLSSGAILALTRTCPTPNHDSPRDSMDSMYALMRASPEERFRMMCVDEEAWGPSGHALLCSACRSRHDVEWFATLEREKRPSERRCRTVRICPHIDVTLAQYQGIMTAMKRGLPFPPPNDTSFTLCGREPKFPFHACGTLGSEHVSTSFSWWQGSAVHDDSPAPLYLRTHVFIKLAAFPPTGSDKLELLHVRSIRGSAGLGFLVCPHKKAQRCLETIVGKTPLEGGTRSPSEFCGSCATEIYAVMRETLVELSVWRRLGKGEAPLDRDWLGQM
ncbi:MAG: hypothetical protein M1837_000604 [Sclerophora amabilis]|nr:MAG: hypothetical protein M1837_000604 [Sclerophora amabilis]